MSSSFNKRRFDSVINGVHVFLKGATIALIVLTSILLVLGFVFVFIPKGLLDFDMANLQHINVQIMNVLYSLDNPELTGIINVKGLLILAAFLGVANLLFLIVILKLLQKVIGDVKQKQPFSQNNIKYLKYLGYVYLISSVVLPLVNQFLSMYIINLFDIWEANVMLRVNLQAAFMGVIILILASVFEYGKYLQEDHDLTV